jgi:hypothetical protein
MAVTIEGSAVSRATPEEVFAAWTDVNSWTEGDYMERASIDREFAPGAVIRAKVKGFPTATLVVTQVDPPKVWVDESRMPGVRMSYEHRVEPVTEGTSLTERVTISGPLARVVGALVRGRMVALFSASTQHIARRAEG